MMNKHAHYLLVYGTLFALAVGGMSGCSRKATPEQAFIGKWKTISLHVTMPSYNNTDSTVVLDFTEEDLDTRFPMKPVVTTLNEDGTYFSEYRSRGDSVVARPTGEWSLGNDSLTMHQLTPAEFTFVYHVRVVNDRIEFRILTDYDHDGKVDDEMVSVSRRIITP